MAVLLEDFATLRNVHDGTKALWTVYNGEGQTQTGSLDSGLGAFKSHITGLGSSAIYVYTNVRGDNEGYEFPYGYVQYYIKSGTFDVNCNRLSYWVKSTDSVARSTGGGHSVEWGTYIRDQDVTDPNEQGSHYYHFLGGPWGLGSGWTYVVMNRQPQHQVGGDANANWNEDPEFVAQGGHYFENLSHFYFDGQNPGDFTVPKDWWFANFQFDTVANEPDTLISNICCAHDGTNYHLTWNGPKYADITYTVYRGSSSLQNANGTYNGTGTSVGTATTQNSAYTGLDMSFAFAEASTLYLFILPDTGSIGTQIVKTSSPDGGGGGGGGGGAGNVTKLLRSGKIRKSSGKIFKSYG